MVQELVGQVRNSIEAQQKKILEHIQHLADTADAERYWQTGIEIRAELRTIRELLDTVELRLVTSAPAPKDELNYTGIMAIGSPEKSKGLVSMEEVMELLTNGGQRFVDLEPIRKKYEERFGDEQCWSFPFCDGDHLGGVIMPVQEGVLYLPYDYLDTECYEQFVTENACLLEKEKAAHMRKLLQDHCAGLSTVLRIIEQLPEPPQKNSKVQDILAYIEIYIRMDDYPVAERMPMNDLNRELIKAMTEEQGSPIYLGTFYSDELVPYTGQTVYNFQYNFCLPVKSEPLQKLLRDGLDKATTFDKFYQLLHDLGGHVLFWV